jgi:hypothetical protein
MPSRGCQILTVDAEGELACERRADLLGVIGERGSEGQRFLGVDRSLHGIDLEDDERHAERRGRRPPMLTAC